MTSAVFKSNHPKWCKCHCCWTIGRMKYTYIEDTEEIRRALKKDMMTSLLPYYKYVCKRCAVRLAI